MRSASQEPASDKSPSVILKHKKVWGLVIVLIGVAWFVPWVFLLYGNSITVTQQKANGESIEVAVGPDEKGWTPLAEIPKHVRFAFIAAEDNKFYSHWGIDISSVLNSVRYNWQKGRYARGGSTITQQLVKVAFLSQEKSLLRKMREASGALAIEAVGSKDLILTWYLNLIEFGRGIYGIKEAARHYFGVSPRALTRNQAINLALVLPNPKTWSAGLKRRTLTEFGEKRFAAIVTNMRLLGFISTEEWQQSMATGNFGAPISHYPKVFREAIAGLRQKAFKDQPAPEGIDFGDDLEVSGDAESLDDHAELPTDDQNQSAVEFPTGAASQNPVAFPMDGQDQSPAGFLTDDQIQSPVEFSAADRGQDPSETKADGEAAQFLKDGVDEEVRAPQSDVEGQEVNESSGLLDQGEDSN